MKTIFPLKKLTVKNENNALILYGELLCTENQINVIQLHSFQLRSMAPLDSFDELRFGDLATTVQFDLAGAALIMASPRHQAATLLLEDIYTGDCVLCRL